MTTRLYEHKIFLGHRTPEGHPERADQLRSLAIALSIRISPELDRKDAPQDNEDVVLLAHPESGLRTCRRTLQEDIDPADRGRRPATARQAALTGIMVHGAAYRRGDRQGGHRLAC